MRFLVLLFFISSFSAHAICKQRTVKSKNTQVRLIELYTSEGCSSCPPTERWMNSFAKKENLFKDFVPVAFHVDYWNYLGHRDTLSKKEHTNRQRALTAEWGGHTIYTPGVILDGREYRSRRFPMNSNKKVGVIEAKKIGKGEFKVSFDKFEKGDQLFATVLGSGITHRIRRGENKGATLKHNFAVLEYQKVKLKNGQAIVKLDVSKRKNVNKMDVAFWVSRANSLRPVQAVGMCL